MIQISDNTQQIQPSKIRKMFNKALEYDRVLSFTLGEPDFTASANVVEAGCRAIREGKTKYSATPVWGFKSTNTDFYLCSWAMCKIYRPNQCPSNRCT